MQHLDEGTIHAWLDGALDAEQSREIEAHVAACRACSANVAEARGLIAASSRILTALDDVPAGVTPKRAPVAPKPVRRQWRAAPWVTGIAAVLLLAIGLVQVNRNRPLFVVADTAARGALASLTDSIAPAAAPQAGLEAAPSAQTTAPAVASVARDQMRPASVRRERAADLAANAPMAGAPVTGAGAGARGAAIAGGDERSRRLTSQPAAPAPAAAVAAADVATEAQNQNVTARGSAAVADRVPAAKRADPVATQQLGGFPASGVAGCYRLDAQAQRITGLDAPAPARAAVGRAAGAQREAAVAAKPAPPPFSGMLRLDTVSQPAGFRVVRHPSDSTIGSWVRVSDDTASVRLLSGTVFTVTRRDRVPCPEGH